MQTESQSAYVNKQSRDGESPGELYEYTQKRNIKIRFENKMWKGICPVLETVWKCSSDSKGILSLDTD